MAIKRHELATKGRNGKYNAQKTVLDGIRFDSKKESQRYAELKLLERAGVISDLKLQPAFILLEGFEKNGKKHRAITYKADFSYTEGGKQVIEDVKGFVTKEFAIKQKMFEAKYPELELKII